MKNGRHDLFDLQHYEHPKYQSDSTFKDSEYIRSCLTFQGTVTQWNMFKIYCSPYTKQHIYIRSFLDKIEPFIEQTVSSDDSSILIMKISYAKQYYLPRCFLVYQNSERFLVLHITNQDIGYSFNDNVYFHCDIQWCANYLPTIDVPYITLVISVALHFYSSRLLQGQ